MHHSVYTSTYLNTPTYVHVITFDVPSRYLQLIWQKLYKASQEDYGSLYSIFARIGRSKAKKPKDDMHSCQESLLTVFKGHIVTAGCKEMDIEGNILWNSTQHT